MGCHVFNFGLLVSLSCFVGKHKEKISSVADEARGKRNAIRLQEAYTVETVVVADSDMVQYHGAEAAQRFLLTVMNMVRMFCIAHWQSNIESNLIFNLTLGYCVISVK